MSEQNGVITLEEIKRRAQGEVIEIPDWDGKGKIKVRVRKIDLTMHLLGSGLLPNQLKMKVQEVFEGKRPKKGAFDEVDLDLERFGPILEAIAKEALIEPTFDDIQAILPLTLSQKLEIFNHVTAEVRQLESFRGKQ